MIGCGRAAESLHLPAAALATGTETTVLVDRDLARARALARSYGVTEVRQRAEEVVGLADAAVVALPHHLHAPVTRELLEAGLHVLVEKPLALSAGECVELAALAARRGLTLAVGMIRRRFPAARFMKLALERELLGELERVTVREGSPFRWEVASDFTFRRETGGGVLADTGVHVLDLLQWWFGEPRVEACRDDAAGGVEAECEMELALLSGTPVLVELSRTRELSNSARVEGSRGVLEVGTGFGAEVRLDLGMDAGGADGLGANPLVGEARPVYRRYQNVRELFIEQLEDFVRAVGTGGEPLVGASEALRSVELMERCREVREPWKLPWVEIRRGVPA
jgi:predicted dehydrogenase